MITTPKTRVPLRCETLENRTTPAVAVATPIAPVVLVDDPTVPPPNAGLLPGQPVVPAPNQPPVQPVVPPPVRRPIPATAFVVGSPFGEKPVVTIYNANGTRFETLPTMGFNGVEGLVQKTTKEYFTGGVNAVLADVNGDGVNDVIVSAGAGGGPRVQVFDGVSRQEVSSFLAYDSGFRGGVSIAAGDVNGDGVADIITGAGAGGGPHVKAFSGKTGAEVLNFMAYDPMYRGGVNVSTGVGLDATSGRRTDIVVGSGAGMTATIAVFNGRNGEQLWTANPFGTFTGGVNVATADLDGNGRDVVIAGAGSGGGPRVVAVSRTTEVANFDLFAQLPGFTGGVGVAAQDLNGDGKDDILTTAGGRTAETASRVKAFRGTDELFLFGLNNY
jgi:hypothetical protein